MMAEYLEYIDSYDRIKHWCGNEVSKDVAQKLLTRCACFAVVYREDGNYKWSHFSSHHDDCSVDLLIIVHPNRWNKLAGFIVADNLYISGDTYYDKTLIQNLQQILGRVMVLGVLDNNNKKICANLSTVPLSVPMMNGILRAAVDSLNANQILSKTIDGVISHLQYLPSPEVFFNLPMFCKSCHKPCYIQYKGDDWVCFVDVCVVVEVLPHLIKHKKALLYDGYVPLFKGDFFDNLAIIYTKILRNKSKDSRLIEWVGKMKTIQNMDPYEHEYPEWKYVKQINTAAEQRRRRNLENVIQYSSPPKCIAEIAQRGQYAPWKNDDRWQLAYVLRSVSEEWGISPHIMRDAYVNIMQDAFMGSKRISEFKHIMNSSNANFKDKTLCTFRVPSQQGVAGVTCPYGGGVQGVTECMRTRQFKVKNLITPENATVSKIWAFSNLSAPVKEASSNV